MAQISDLCAQQTNWMTSIKTMFSNRGFNCTLTTLIRTCFRKPLPSETSAMLQSPDGKPIYELGYDAFVVNCKDAKFERELVRILPGARKVPEEIYEVNGANDVRSLVNEILARHSDCIWLDAACLRSPCGKVVLICGKSGAGKSTTAMALALGYGWKVLSEDITLLNWRTNEIVVFASPFSVKKGTMKRLKSTLAMPMPKVILGEWVSLGSMRAEKNYTARFDLSIYLSKPEGGSALNVTDMAATQFIRRILTNSNIVHCPEAAEQLVDYLSAGRCCQIGSGTLRERVEFILGSLQT